MDMFCVKYRGGGGGSFNLGVCRSGTPFAAADLPNGIRMNPLKLSVTAPALPDAFPMTRSKRRRALGRFACAGAPSASFAAAAVLSFFGTPSCFFACRFGPRVRDRSLAVRDRVEPLKLLLPVVRVHLRARAVLVPSAFSVVVVGGGGGGAHLVAPRRARQHIAPAVPVRAVVALDEPGESAVRPRVLDRSHVLQRYGAQLLRVRVHVQDVEVVPGHDGDDVRVSAHLVLERVSADGVQEARFEVPDVVELILGQHSAYERALGWSRRRVAAGGGARVGRLSGSDRAGGRPTTPNPNAH
eukprot:28676-Pelagococcus_subviridis.AAC.3